MAQALFDEHPLEEYLRESGESPMIIPGISSELEQEIDLNYGLMEDVTSDEDQSSDWFSQLLLEFIGILQSVASMAKPQAPTSSFVERFKYNVISSSLLELSLPTPNPQRTHSLRIPGNLQHSRNSSVELDQPPTPFSTSSPEYHYGPVSITALLAALLLSLGYPSLTFVFVMAASYFLYTTISTTETPKHDMTSSLNALDDLVAANDTWDSVVQDAMRFLDSADNNLHSSTGPSSPSPIRVALHSCLQTTHTQCDNIRHLFSALTSPTNLSQLSEMYGPPSPAATTFTPEAVMRPLSGRLSHLNSLSYSTPTTPQNKRSTWNGSYSSLTYAGSPTKSLFQRRERRKAGLSDALHADIKSAPTSPLVNAATPEPQEDFDESMAEYVDPEFNDISEDQNFRPQSQFGAAALGLQRRRKSGGMEAFRMPPASYFSPDNHSPRSVRNSVFATPSKFTNAQASRHPLSYSAMNHSLQNTLAAKRYACSHLLALRFGDDEDEGYWEDVRSVMGLLSSTLMDGYSRLAEALHEVEQQKLRDQSPTPVMPDSPGSELNFGVANNLSKDDNISPSSVRWQKSANRVSFVPMPNNINRFAAHIAAISSALDDARDNLDQCVAELKVDSSPSSHSHVHRQRHSRTISGSSANADTEESQALQAYERLRRELGLALRECERGRSCLMDIINPPMAPSDEDDFDDLPGLGHDASDDSDKADHISPDDDEAEAALATAARFRPVVVSDEAGEGDVPVLDDATSHLLLATSTQHLPLPGIEEVFEADTGAKTTFTREKSRLSREERIKIAKARRESGMGLSIGVGSANSSLDDDAADKGGIEKWGPGGEVVQELKDVIWKVGERRRKMTPAGITTTQAETPCDPPSESIQLATLESS